MIAVTRTRRAARGSTSAQAAARPPRQPGSIRNVLSNWGAFVFTAAVGLVLSPMVVQGLGDTLYGVWVLIGSMVGYLGLLDLGVRGAVMRYLAKLHAASDHREAGRIAAAALALFAASGTAAILLSVVVALGVEHIFTIPEDMVRVARIVLVVGGINVAIALVTGVFGGVVTAMQRFDLLSGVDVAVEAGRALAIALALHLGEGLVVLAVIQLAASAVRGMASVIISHHLYPELRFALRSLPWWGTFSTSTRSVSENDNPASSSAVIT